MVFESFDFAQLNEADVREEILAPFLRKLGYRSGTCNNIIREQSLRYPRFFLGRKDSHKDPELRGKADYICEADRKIRWTIEAKSPAREITSDDIEQAYTYSNHPEVRAVYFCVCNGHKLKVYQTSHAPDHPPILSISYMEFREKFDIIQNLLSPQSICRDFPTQILDTGKPLGAGLRSIVRITGGYIQYEDNSLDLPQLKGLITTVTGGAVERNENGQLVALVETRSPFAMMQRFNERLGLSELELISNDATVSVDPNKPTTFLLSQRTYFSAGEKMFDLGTWREIKLPFNVVCDADTSVEGVLVGQDFAGVFHIKLKNDFSNLPPAFAITLSSNAPLFERLKLVTINGKFGVHLA